VIPSREKTSSCAAKPSGLTQALRKAEIVIDIQTLLSGKVLCEV
jgi:hypothetical protein